MKNHLLTTLLAGSLLLVTFPAMATESESISPSPNPSLPLSYPIVDSGQTACYGLDGAEIACPATGQPLSGQDAQHTGNAPAFLANGDGTVTDTVTGLMWQQGFIAQLTYAEAVAGAKSFALAGHSDWRLPSIKELYSLIDFRGIDPSACASQIDCPGVVPFIDTTVFAFQYGDTSIGDRMIDAQYWSATEYVGTTMSGNATTFGVNFADGRIKGYPSQAVGPLGQQVTKRAFVRYVRGNPLYGINDFVDHGNGTITDQATGLMWSQEDLGCGMNWQEALAAIENKNKENYLGHDDWRLPNVKELQSIVDYTRAPSVTNSPALSPLFLASAIIDEGGAVNYPFYWTSTTHQDSTLFPGRTANYIAFGEALGWMRPPFGGDYALMDVHGAGAQRSDPKSGTASDWPYGHGPQGDVIRIDNYVRLVRDATEGVVPSDSTTFTLHVSPGWNLLSSPIAFPPSTLFDAGGSCLSVWTWVEGSAGIKTWAVSLAGDNGGSSYAASQGFLPLPAIHAGEGFWLNCAGEQTVAITGPADYGALNVSSGWNLMGVKGKEELTVAEVEAADPGIASVWSWDNGNGSWTVHVSGEAEPGAYAQSKGFTALMTINPGVGFWVNKP